MPNEINFYLTALLAVAIIVLAGFVVISLDFSQHKYSVVKDGVEFVSDYQEPSAMLADIRVSDSFVVSPVFTKKGVENNHMTSSLTLFTTVFTAKEKNVVVVARLVSDENGELISCQSNFGDLKVNKEISVDECEFLLSSSPGVKIFVERPPSDKKLQSSVVLLEKGKITITPSSFESVSHVSFVVLSALYDDTESIISRINGIVGSL